MSYREIIRDNCQNHSAVHWWPRLAYHYTDVKNAVSILKSGMLYSRIRAERLGVMQNDNASKQVIDMTKTEALSSVRFYFRPLTPTQFYNEGFKHPQLRYDNDENANTPVPIFFTFDLERLLSMPGVRFSEQKQAGYGSPLLSGEEAFSKMNFDYIYSNGSENFAEKKPYRHAEILHPNPFRIDTAIHSILCRNSVERLTFLNILKREDPFAYQKYRNIIKVCNRDMFEENSLFITDCQYHDNVINLSFSEKYRRRYYTERMKDKNEVAKLKPVKLRIELDWYNRRSSIHHAEISALLDYEEAKEITCKGLQHYSGATILSVKVYFEQDLMCFMEYPLSDAELIK